jgi:hypothetical protein
MFLFATRHCGYALVRNNRASGPAAARHLAIADGCHNLTTQRRGWGPVHHDTTQRAYLLDLRGEVVVSGTLPAGLIAAAVALLLCFCQPYGTALARDRSAAVTANTNGDNDKGAQIDSEHLFGLLEGSDIGDAGEKELELDALGRFGKRGGSYATTSNALFFKYTAVENFRIAPMISFSSHNISNVPGLQNRDQFRLDGAGVELRYRLLDRERAPFGLTLSALPQRTRIDETIGLPVEQYAVEFTALIDKELVADRLFGALNVLYEPAWTRPWRTHEWERDATVGVGAALSLQIAPGFFLGAGARYLWRYEGIGLDTLLGEAFFIGPSFYLKLPNHWFASGGWNVQVGGRAVGEALSLDLTNFERHEGRLQVGFAF